MRLVRYTYPNVRSAYRSPFAGFESEIGRLFESALTEGAAPASDRFPVDLYEDKDSLYVRAELPGIERADINVEVIEDYLNLTASRKSQENGVDQSVAFSRSIAVPTSVQGDKVSAQYQDGVLTVTLPKKEEAKPRKIAVSVS